MEMSRKKLSHVFGMDLVELPKLREKLNQSQTQLKSNYREQVFLFLRVLTPCC